MKASAILGLWISRDITRQTQQYVSTSQGFIHEAGDNVSVLECHGALNFRPFPNPGEFL